MCLFQEEGDSKVIIIFWVNDNFLAASSESVQKEIKKTLSNRFKMKDQGELKWFLGIEFRKSTNQIEMSQKHYTERVLECFGMSNCKPHSAPCTEDINKDKEESSELPIPRV